eukprot:m51a1_g8985 putative formate dehydrogenase / nitrate reductase (662) ;mRNA; r:57059-59224
MDIEQAVTVCARDCYDTCSVVARRSRSSQQLAGALTGDPAHPVTRGWLCPRGARDHVNSTSASPSRVLQPRVRDGDRFRDASWPEALGRIASAVEATAPERRLVLVYAGNMGLLASSAPLRLWSHIGAVQVKQTLCLAAGKAALALHYGPGARGPAPEDALPSARMVVFWGFNAAVSAAHIWSLACANRDARIVVVDPRGTATSESKSTSMWVRPRPGADAAVAMAVARRLFERGAADTAFLGSFAVGWERYRDLVFSREAVDAARPELTGVTPEQIDALAELYQTLRPSVTMIGIGLQRCEEGAEAVRAISLIPSILGMHRGFLYYNSYPVDYDVLERCPGDQDPQTVAQTVVGPMLAQGKFGFVFVSGMNPAMTLPDQTHVRAGLRRPDTFVVVHETQWTETCDFADVVLPACSFLEKEDMQIPYMHRCARLSPAVLPPAGSSVSEYQLMQMIARELGLTDAPLFEDPRVLLARAMRGSLEGVEEGQEMERLLSGELLRLRQLPLDRYATPSGKIEFWSSGAEAAGLPPMPRVVAPRRQADGTFVLLNSAGRMHTHTQFQKIHGALPQEVHMCRADAERSGLAGGVVVALRNSGGEVHLKLVVSESVSEGVVWSVKETVGLNGSPLNVLTSSEGVSYGQGAPFNGATVTIHQATTKAAM